MFTNKAFNAEQQVQMRNFLPRKRELTDMSVFFNSFADPTRLKILSALSLTPMCVQELSRVVDTNQTTVSHQLKLMRERGLIQFLRLGKMLRYEISSKFVAQTLECGVDFLNNQDEEGMNSL